MQKSVFVGKQFINMFLTSNMFYNHNIAIPVKKKESKSGNICTDQVPFTSEQSKTWTV